MTNNSKKMVKKYIYSILSVITLISCSAPRVVYRDVPVHITKRDTTILIDTVIDVNLETIRDTMTVTAVDSSFLRNKYCESWARVDSSGLHHSLKTRPLARIRSPAKIEKKIEYVEKEKIVKQPVEIYKQTDFQSFQSKAFWFLIIFIIFIIKRNAP